jgi:hypothetical protein
MEASVLSHMNLKREFDYIQAKGFPEPSDLCELMASFGSDKGKGLHNYSVVYDWLLSRFRKQNLQIFELGLGTNKVGAPPSMGPNGRPGASLRAWREYLPQAQIYGADIDGDILFAEDRIRTFWADQRDPKAIRALWHQLDGVSFDVMIDDGLHEARANICFFMESFYKLKPGGIYVIEDITPSDIDLMSALTLSLSCVCSSVVFEQLEHRLNKVDNRLLLCQRA